MIDNQMDLVCNIVGELHRAARASKSAGRERVMRESQEKDARKLQLLKAHLDKNALAMRSP